MYCEEGNGVFCIDVIILIVETSCLDPPSTYLLSFPQVVYLIINLSTFYCLFLNLNYGAFPLLFLLSLSLFLPPFLSPFSPLPLSLFPFSSLSLYLIPSPPPSSLSSLFLSGLLVSKHCGVLGLAALVQACPYTIPEWLPGVVDELSSHLHDPAPIPVSVYVCV